jgi:hypothetical protein
LALGAMHPEFPRLSRAAGRVDDVAWRAGRHRTHLRRRGVAHIEHIAAATS